MSSRSGLLQYFNLDSLIMAFVSFPIITNNLTCRNGLEISHIYPTSTIHKTCKKIKANNVSSNFHPSFFSQPLIRRRHNELSVVPIFCAKKSPQGEDGKEEDQQDPHVLETMQKLYHAMKNKDVVELSKIVADKPDIVGNLPPILQPLQGKKKVADFFFNLMRHLSSDIQFIVKPTLHDGMNVGLQWGIGWDKTHRPFGKGFSFHISHHYNGKFIIKNFEMFVEPLLHFPYRTKLNGIMTALSEKMASDPMFRGRGSKVVSSIVLAFVIAAFLISLLT